MGAAVGALLFQLFDGAPALLAGVDALAVPFKTQFDGSAYASTDCGPASVAMVIEYETGDKLTPLQARQAIMKLPGGGYASNPNSGTAIQDLGRVARQHGLDVFSGDGASSVGWGPERIRKHLAQGHPVIVLTRVGYLPGYTPGTPIDHYIVLTGTSPTGYVYNDPAFSNGIRRQITEQQLVLAQRASSVPGQGIAFDGPRGIGKSAEAQLAGPTFKITVAKGDTLSQLAKRYSLELKDVLALNRGVIRNPDHIEVGQVLTLPGTDPQAAATDQKPPLLVAAGPMRQGARIE
jgi:hypothetical protein